MDDFLIIGSGFGGAVAAHALTQAGAQVTLLERGPWRDTLPMRSAGVTPRAPLPQGRHFFTHALFRVHHPRLPTGGLQLHRHGLLEAFLDDGLRVICASGVGGGSHAYGGLHGRPLQADYWDNRAEGLSAADMEPHYAAMLALFGSSPAPREADGQRPAYARQPWEQQTHAFIELPHDQQPAWGYLFAQKPGQPTRVIRDGVERREVDFAEEGMFGSPRGGKTTLDAACVLPAIRAGLKVRDCHEALCLARAPAGGFNVDVRDLRSGRTSSLTARRVILAAGAINSVALLLRSRAAGGLAAMPALGKGFGSNGDVMAWFAVNTHGANHPTAGIYQRIFRHRDDAAGPLLLQAGLSGLAAVPLLPGPVRRRLQRDLFIAAMGMDAADGVITLENGRLRIRYDKQHSPVFARIEEHLEALRQLSGHKLHAPPGVATVHPLGGARVGDHIQTAVVNGQGEVLDVPGLYVSDASILPSAPGSPPSLSIAAWARHVAGSLARRG